MKFREISRNFEKSKFYDVRGLPATDDGGGVYTCGARIDWKRTRAGGGLSRTAAIRFVAQEIPDPCGPCLPPPTPRARPSLEYHRQRTSSPGSAHRTALAGGWDFVVLQDRSDIPSRCCYTEPWYQDGDFGISEAALVALDAAIAEAGATTVLYQTWGRRGSLNRPPYFR